MQPNTFVFFGIVGSGKGTQITLLQDFLKKNFNQDSLHAYPGNEYRKITASSNQIASLVKEILEKGKLQPDFLTNAIFTNILINSLNENITLIADGYPRTINQSEEFLAQMNFFKRGNIKIIYIKLSEEEAMKRNLLRGRSDDTEEGLKRRFAEYKNNVVPSMEFLKNKNIEVIEINGEQSIEAVHNDILKALNFSN
ncbi:MAG: nucleoside monophosphate kinase [Candidatus Pacebacteria bacterium]|nr:nucleoside monophosphate kinase [Candidatus Paceibacterota bacterium]